MKKLLVILGVLLGIVLLAGIAIVLLVNVNAYKPRIETAVSDALGMEFRIRGNASLRLLPSPAIALADVRLTNRGTDLADAGTLRIGIRLLPLLHRRIEITEFTLDKPVLRIEKGADGKFNFETPPRPAKSPAGEEGPSPAAPLVVADSSLENGRILYVDRKSGKETLLDGVNLSVRNLSVPTGSKAEPSRGISFTGKLMIGEVKTKGFTVSDVRASVTAGNGVYEIRPFTMRLFGGKGEGEIRADLSKRAPTVSVKYKLADFRAEDAVAAFTRKKTLSGPMTLSPDLSFRGKEAGEMTRTLDGGLSLRGEGLTLYGMDIDEVLSKMKEARSMNLADVGAFLLTGPLGPAAIQGYRFGGVYESAVGGGETRITRLVSDWTVKNGIAEAKDVAFATRKNRIALKGKLDLVDERFVDVTVAALDEKGCAKVRQRISGPFRDPRFDKVSTLQSVAGSILSLFEKAKKFMGRPECEPFYTGSVPAPG